jgi:protein-S-isoprenylcysteine O-methyltransferase Ste14
MIPLFNRISAGGLSVLLAFLLMAAILYEGSPFYQDVAKNSPLRMIVLLINIPSVFVVTGFRSLFLGVVVFVCQWFLIGVLIHWIISRIRKRPDLG